MKLRKKLHRICAALLYVGILQSTSALASEFTYQEKASDIIMNSLQQQKSKGFLLDLYKTLFFIPEWMHEKNISPAAKDLFGTILSDGTLNKNGKIYIYATQYKEEAKKLYSIHASIAQKIALEFKISQLYEAYTNYRYFGSINWGAFNARISNLMVNDVNTEWVLHRPRVNPIQMLEEAALGKSLSALFKKAEPHKYHYQALKKELEKYRAIQATGGWNKVTLKGKLRAGKSTPNVPSLRERLRVTGDYIPCKGSSEGLTYNKCLQKAVKHFQERNGLSPDGEVGSSTLKILNKSVDDRVTTLLLNLDRIKWLKKREAKHRVIINIPDFMLYFIEDGKVIQKIRTVVGKPNHPTPIFSNSVKTIVFNPYWNIHKRIIQKEMIPKLLKNPYALKKKGIEIYSGWEKDASIVNPASVEWRQYRYSKRVPYRFAQLPGKRNALGKLKFLFPNKYAVYMHDTPAKKLFRHKKRAFSHGCIRLQKPRELLKTFAKFEPNVDFRKSQKILKSKKKTYLSLKEQVPVDVIYLTAWVDDEGNLQFRDDIYGYDAMQLKSFRRW